MSGRCIMAVSGRLHSPGPVEAPCSHRGATGGILLAAWEIPSRPVTPVDFERGVYMGEEGKREGRSTDPRRQEGSHARADMRPHAPMRTRMHARTRGKNKYMT